MGELTPATSLTPWLLRSEHNADRIRCHWLELLALKQHYERAEIIANVADDGSIEIAEPTNITQFAIHPPMLNNANARLRIEGREVVIPHHNSALVFAQQNGAVTTRELDSR